MSEGAKICNHMGLLILLCLSLPMKVSVLRCSRTVEHRFYSRVSLTRISSLFIHTVHDMWNWTKSLGKPQDRYFTVNYLPREICETFWALLMVLGSRGIGILDPRFIIEWHVRCSVWGIFREICLEWHSRGTVHFHVSCTVCTCIYMLQELLCLCRKPKVSCTQLYWRETWLTLISDMHWMLDM